MKEIDYKRIYTISKLQTCHRILSDDLELDAMTDKQLEQIEAARKLILDVFFEMNDELIFL